MGKDNRQRRKPGVGGFTTHSGLHLCWHGWDFTIRVTSSWVDPPPLFFLFFFTLFYFLLFYWKESWGGIAVIVEHLSGGQLQRQGQLLIYGNICKMQRGSRMFSIRQRAEAGRLIETRRSDVLLTGCSCEGCYTAVGFLRLSFTLHRRQMSTGVIKDLQVLQGPLKWDLKWTICSGSELWHRQCRLMLRALAIWGRQQWGMKKLVYDR